MKYIGFDLGDGESAVAILDSDSAIEPKILPLQGKNSLLSSVGVKDGRVVIGEEAAVLSGAENVRVRFKSRYLTDPSAASAVRSFAQGVFAELLKEDPGLTAEVSATIVGCPAGWGEERRMQYASLIESAGFPNVRVIPESRAAFLYARHARGLHIDEERMRTSAVVIDIGSSTTDFAYIIDGHQQEMSLFGDANLGGGLLDELILMRSLDRCADGARIREVFEESPSWKSYCELEARHLKERYFLSENEASDHPLSSTMVVCYRDTLMLDMRLSRDDIGQIIREPIPCLGGRSFLEQLNVSLSAAAKASSACPPQVIILTGGASRMGFFRKACRDAFPEVPLVFCPEPECSIARGLAYAGRVDALLKIFREEVSSLARGEKLRSAVARQLPELYPKISSALFGIIEKQTVADFELWRKGSLHTISDLETHLNGSIPETLTCDASKAALAESLAGWSEKFLRHLEGELTALCIRCGVPPEKMQLSDIVPDSGLPTAALSMMDAMGIHTFGNLIGLLLAIISTMLCGGSGIALISTGLAGIAAGALIGIVIAVIGKNGFEKWISAADIPSFVRHMIPSSSIRDGLERRRESIESDLISQLSDPKNGFYEMLCSGIGETIGAQLEQMASRAEMSITQSPVGDRQGFAPTPHFGE